MYIRLLLVSPEGEIRKVYTQAINSSGVQGVHYDAVATFKDLYDAMARVPYNGILIDLNTHLRAPKEELNLVENILEKFPVLTLKWDAKENAVRTYYPGQHKLGSRLDDFIKNQCLSFDARRISTEKRIDINFSVLLSREKVFREEHLERTITINVSHGGCFIFSNQNWNMHSDVWFIVKGLNDETPIHGTVVWFLEWGKGIQIPGIGVRFLEIKDTQIKELFSAMPINERRNRKRIKV
ncbi:MAG: PilZ domain-containing protein [Planctomycetes bacterium]|nr:PilZ domain-containing protein [Planctomycetota bacterium]